MRRSLNPSSICLFCEHKLFQSSQRPLRTLHRPQNRPYVRPSIAPKPILDIKHILKNPGLYEQNCLDRNYKEQARNSWQILELSRKRAQYQESARERREAYNRVRADIEKLQRVARVKKDGNVDGGEVSSPREALAGLLEQAKVFKAQLGEVDESEKAIETQIQELALALPNLSSTHTPNGDEPQLLHTHTSPSLGQNRENISHVDIGISLDLLDFTSAGTTSGWGWYYLKNAAALLEQALIQYTITFLLARGWTFVTPPSMVYTHIAGACGFAPRDANDEQQIYHISQAAKDVAKPPLSLAATAEIPLAGMHAGKTLNEEHLPLKTVAVSRCYRAEAGARGVDTKGLYRVHEFTKVEMFAWTLPDDLGESQEHFGTSQASQTASSHSEEVFNDMVDIQQHLLRSLDLSFRVLEMPATDLGGPAIRKKDMEAFFPSRKHKDEGWGEVTSTSICTDYQSRRLATRVKRADGNLEWPHTVNGTAMAVPRVLAAILETGWDPEEEAVTIPKVLRPWMGGMERIAKKSVVEDLKRAGTSLQSRTS